MMNRLSNLDDLFWESLRDLYHSEYQIIALLPRMAETACLPSFKIGIEKNLKKSKNHVRRIEEISARQGKSLRGVQRGGIVSLIEEGELLSKQSEDPDTRDALLISLAHKLNFYEVASYKTAVIMAEKLGYGEAAGLLQKTLAEEMKAARWLTKIRDTQIQEIAH